MKILVVDDDSVSRQAVSKFLSLALGHEITECESGEEAIDLFKENSFSVVISDIRMPGMNGIELLRALKKLPGSENTTIVMMTGFADTDTAIEALREGARDYLRKPVEAATLSSLLTRIESENIETSKPTDAADKATEVQNDGIVINIPDYGHIGVFSEKMKTILATLYKFHDDPGIPVMIEGETGTGKEGLARLVHHGHGNNPAPFIPVNCSAIAPGLFESELFGYEEGAFTGAAKSGKAGKLELAQEGTIFLDEIGDLPDALQPKLLRVLQENEIFRVGGEKQIPLKVRIVAATNKDLEKEVEAGRFRQDLFFRLNTGIIKLPNLSEIKDSILPLAYLFLTKFAREKQRRFKYIENDTYEILKNYHWPGNVRELQNSIERVVLLNDEESVKPEHVQFLRSEDSTISQPGVTPISIDKLKLPDNHLDYEMLNKEIIRLVLKKFDGNKSEAARYLGISRGSLRRKIDKLQ